MKKKVIFAIAMASMLLCGGISSTNVYANNHADTSYSFTLNSSHLAAETLARPKEDASSTYVNIETIPSNGAWISVYGYVTAGNPPFNYWNDETVGGRFVIRKGKWRVRQNVYEHGGCSAKLYFAKYLDDGKVAGKWSPDSIGNYTYAN